MSVLVAIVDLFLRNKQYPLQCFSGHTLGPLDPHLGIVYHASPLRATVYGFSDADSSRTLCLVTKLK